MHPFDKARTLASLLPQSIPEAQVGNMIYDIGALEPVGYAESCFDLDMTSDWETLDPLLNHFLGICISVDALAKEIWRGKGGVDGLLNLLEWFTKRQGLNKALYEGKMNHLSEVMLTLILSSVFDASAMAQSVDLNHHADLAMLAPEYPTVLGEGDNVDAEGSDEDVLETSQIPTSLKGKGKAYPHISGEEDILATP